jgi:ABC-2 type transport system ATP-binding protein
MSEQTPVVEITNLVRRYGRTDAVNGLNLNVRSGRCYGLFGRNGAGKTTTIKCLLNLIRPAGGRVRVFGLDPGRDEVAVKSRLAYVPDHVAFYPWMTVRGVLDYFAAFRSRWNEETERMLLQRFRLDERQKAMQLSKGQRTQLALITAVCPEPDLLILDEPTSGLDPLVQQTFFDIIREAKAEGRTVFLSSHILGEVEKTCDRVGIIRDGRLVKVDRVEALRDLAHHQVELRFAGDVPVGAFSALPGVSDVSANEHVLRMRVSGSITPVVREAARYELLDFVSREPSLEETFLAQYGRSADQAA